MPFWGPPGPPWKVKPELALGTLIGFVFIVLTSDFWGSARFRLVDLFDCQKWTNILPLICIVVFVTRVGRWDILHKRRPYNCYMLLYLRSFVYVERLPPKQRRSRIHIALSFSPWKVKPSWHLHFNSICFNCIAFVCNRNWFWIKIELATMNPIQFNFIGCHWNWLILMNVDQV